MLRDGIVLNGLLHCGITLRLSLQLLVKVLLDLSILCLSCHLLHLGILRSCLLDWDCHWLMRSLYT